MLIDIVPTPPKLCLNARGLDTRLFANKRKAFAEDHQLMPRKIVLLDGLADDLLRHTIRVHVRSVPLWNFSRCRASFLSSELHNPDMI